MGEVSGNITNIWSSSESNRSLNDHIEQYLDYYIDLPYPPLYAVMLNGQWGVGKTYFIQRYLEKIRKKRLETSQKQSHWLSITRSKVGAVEAIIKRDYIYVSLYGVSSKDELQWAVLSAQYAALEWKSTQILSQVSTIALKAFRIEPSKALIKSLIISKALVYVFDDFERCSLTPQETLGYINTFVEHDECKVIIVANESVINDEKFNNYKEKVVGKTFLIRSSLENAFDHFITRLKDSESKQFLVTNKVSIFSVYRRSCLNNLRILQQTIADFERLFIILDLEHKRCANAMHILLKLFIALSIEIKSGRLNEEDLSNRQDGVTFEVMKRMRKKSNAVTEEKQTNWEAALERYDEPGQITSFIADKILSDEVLKDILVRGFFDLPAIHANINGSQYIAKQSTPAWETLWKNQRISEIEFDAALLEVNAQFKDREFKNVGVILHVIGIFLWLASINAIEKSKQEVEKESRDYINDLYSRKSSLLGKEILADGIFGGGYDGYAFHEKNTPEFERIFDYFKSVCDKADRDSHIIKAEALLHTMAIDPDLYFQQLCPTGSQENVYAYIPILPVIEPKIFVETFLAQHPASQRTIMEAFKSRYETGSLSRDLRDELPWLRSVRDLLINVAVDLHPISKQRVSSLIEWYITPFVGPLVGLPHKGN